MRNGTPDRIRRLLQPGCSRRFKPVSTPYKKPMTSMDPLYGTPDRIRTYDLWYRKPTLYPAELRVLDSRDKPAVFLGARGCGMNPPTPAALFLGYTSSQNSIQSHSLLGLEFCLAALLPRAGTGIAYYSSINRGVVW